MPDITAFAGFHLRNYGSEGCGFDLYRARQRNPEILLFRGFYLLKIVTVFTSDAFLMSFLLGTGREVGLQLYVLIFLSQSKSIQISVRFKGGFDIILTN